MHDLVYCTLNTVLKYETDSIQLFIFACVRSDEADPALRDGLLLLVAPAAPGRGAQVGRQPVHVNLRVRFLKNSECKAVLWIHFIFIWVQIRHRIPKKYVKNIILETMFFCVIFFS